MFGNADEFINPNTSMEQPAKRRKTVMSYETPPSQALNVSGASRYFGLSSGQLWEALGQPLKSGGPYSSELTEVSNERRGVGINRFLVPMLAFLEQQNTQECIRRNKSILQETVYEQFHEEVQKYLPSVRFITAAKKEYVKQGAAILRQGMPNAADVKPEDELRRHAKVVFELFDVPS